MTPGLSRRLAAIVGRNPVMPEERRRIVAGTSTAQTWDDIPAEIQQLLREIEGQPPAIGAIRHLMGQHNQQTHAGGFSIDKEWLTTAGHLTLDVIGWIPGWGEPADAINAAWYLAEKDYPNATLSALSAIPVAGYAGSTTKALKGIKAVAKMGKMGRQVRLAKEAAGISRAHGEDEHTGAMVALIPTAEHAERLAVEGGEDGWQLHDTLLYLGKADDWDTEARRGVVAAILNAAKGRGQVEGDGFAVSLFNPGDANDRETCAVLLVGGRDVDAVHEATVGAVTDGLVPEQHSPWVSHVTLTYTDDTGIIDRLKDRVGPVEFDRIRVAFGSQAVDIPLTDEAADRARAALYMALVEHKPADTVTRHRPGGRDHGIGTSGRPSKPSASPTTGTSSDERHHR